ncbi:hypothetical protein IWW56_006422, partial [Coemansia sp. RSA 2131]
PVSTTDIELAIISELEPVLRSYNVNYKFENDNIHYDAKANPAKHLKAFVWLNMIFAEWSMTCTQALPCLFKVSYGTKKRNFMQAMDHTD